MPEFDGRNWSLDVSQPEGGSVIGNRGRAVTKFNAALIGGPELAAKLDKLVKEVAEAATFEAVTAMCDMVAGSWRSLVVVGPGTLHYRDAIQAKVRKGKYGAGGTVAVREIPGADLDGEDQPVAYVRALEFGKGHQPSRPWARAGFEAAAGLAVDEAEKILRAAAEGV